MIESAFAWASANGLVRVNPVHGEEEARLILSDTFEVTDETGSMIEMEGNMEVEDN